MHHETKIKNMLNNKKLKIMKLFAVERIENGLIKSLQLFNDSKEAERTCNDLNDITWKKERICKYIVEEYEIK